MQYFNIMHRPRGNNPAHYVGSPPPQSWTETSLFGYLPSSVPATTHGPPVLQRTRCPRYRGVAGRPLGLETREQRDTRSHLGKKWRIL